MFTKVLVGVDGGQGGRDAIALAQILLAPDGELTLAHVFHEEPPGPYHLTDTTVVEDRGHARELLEGAAREAGVQAHLRWRGDTSVGRGL